MLQVRGRQGARTGSQMLWAGGEVKGEPASVLKKKKSVVGVKLQWSM